MSVVAELSVTTMGLPAGWTKSTLGQVSTVKARIGWRGLSAGEYTEHGPYLIAGKHIKSGIIDWVACDHISQFRYNESTEIQLQIGDVIFSKDGSIGNPALIQELPGPTTINGTMMMVRAHQNALEPSYLYQLVCGAEFHRLIREKISGSSIPHIFQRDIVHFPILLPSINEQRRIAEVLRSVDEALTWNAETARHLWSLRKLALAEFFVASGDEGAEETVLGRLRADWRVVTADDVCEAVIDCKNRTPPITDDGPAVVRTMNVRRGRFIRVNLARTDAHSFGEWTKRGKPQIGDVLITREAPIGEVCAVPHDEPICLGQRMMLYRPRQSDLHSGYLLYALQSAGVQEHLLRLAGGSTVGHVRVGDIRHLPLPVPDMKTQVAVAEAMADIDHALDQSEQAVARLQIVKAALSADLLSGRVRVPA